MVSPYVIPGLPKREVTFERILKAVIKNTGIENIFDRTKKAETVEARYISIYLVRKYLLVSMVTAGKMYGKDHSTIVYACRTIKDRMTVDKKFKAKVKSIEQAI